MSNIQIIIIAGFFLYGIKKAIGEINYRFGIFGWEKDSKIYDNDMRDIFRNIYIPSNSIEGTIFFPKYIYEELTELAFQKKLEEFRDIHYPNKSINYSEVDKSILVVFSNKFNHINSILKEETKLY